MCACILGLGEPHNFGFRGIPCNFCFFCIGLALKFIPDLNDLVHYGGNPTQFFSQLSLLLCLHSQEFSASKLKRLVMSLVGMDMVVLHGAHLKCIADLRYEGSGIDSGGTTC